MRGTACTAGGCRGANGRRSIAPSSRSSCCSKPGSRPPCPISNAGCARCPISPRWPPHPGPACSNCGKVLDTTRASATCTGCTEGRRPARSTAHAEAWRELPGVGPYTAAAITSLAFGAPAACVDGNVVRVLAGSRGSDPVPRSFHRSQTFRPVGWSAARRGRSQCPQSGDDGARRARVPAKRPAVLLMSGATVLCRRRRQTRGLSPHCPEETRTTNGNPGLVRKARLPAAALRGLPGAASCEPA